MKSQTVTVRFRLGVLLLGLTGFAVVSGAQAVRTITLAVDGARPLVSAIEELERKLGWVITYEETPWVYSRDIADVTESVRRDQNRTQRVLVPRGGSFAFSGALLGETAESQTALLEAVLEQYHSQGYPGRFSLRRTADVFHVVVSQRRDKKGVLEPVRAVLDVPVTVAPGDRSVLDMVEAIVQQVRKNTGANVGVGLLPVNVLIPARVTDGVANESARTALAKLLGGLPAKVSWQLMCGGGADARCYFSVLYLGPK